MSGPLTETEDGADWDKGMERAVPREVASTTARSRGGDAAFVTLAAGKLPDGYRLAGYLLGNAADAEDATQEAMLKAWQAWPTLRDEARFGAWFDRIVVNVCRNRLRGGRVKVVAVGDDLADALAGSDPFREFLAHDELAALIASLDPDRRMVVVLRFWQGLSLEEIAERLEIPLGTVKSRLHYALDTLRERIGRETGEVPE